jgi:hypothetical protein
MKKTWTSARRTAIAVMTAMMIVFAAGAVSAGEVTGRGEYIFGEETPHPGNSECAYSGRQDNYAEDEGLFRSMITQNWGQIPKFLKGVLTSMGLAPGSSCNPS